MGWRPPSPDFHSVPAQSQACLKGNIQDLHAMVLTPELIRSLGIHTDPTLGAPKDSVPRT